MDEGAELLRELEARYWAMVEQAPEALMVLDLERQRFVEVNAQACRLFAMDRADLVREGPLSMSPPTQPDGRRSDEAAKSYIDRAMAGEIPTFDWLHVDAVGREVPCRVQLARVPSEGRRLVRASLVDITKSRESERRRQRLEAIIEATPDMVGWAGADGRAQYLNPAGRRQLEIGPNEDVAGMEIAQFHPPAWARRIMEEALPVAMRDGVWRGETEFVTRSGRVFPASQVLVAHRDDAGEVEYVATIVRDISEQREAHQLQRKMLRGQKLESLGVLASGIAHDFNNILVGILGNADLMLRRLPDDSHVRGLAKDIERSALRASDLAQQMLAYVGQAQVEKQEVRLDRVVRDVSRLVDASVAKTARLDFDFDDDVPPVIGDPVQLRQVVMNLIINASDALAGEPGEVSVSTRLTRIERGALAYDYLPSGVSDAVMIEVRDTGAGIPRDALERVFDPFYTTKFTGRGLGLAAVLGIVRSHAGALSVDSAPGRGTRFRVYLAPVTSEWDEPEGTDSGAPRPEWRGTGTVLVVDDEEMVRRVVCAVLTDLGFDVLEAGNGADGVALFQEHVNRIVAVVLDLTMPEMSGAQVLARLREIRPDVPVMLVSGYAEPTEGLDAEGFLHKPFTLDAFEAAVRLLVDGSGDR